MAETPAEFRFESTDLLVDTEAESAWISEIGDRVRAVDGGRVTGIAYEDVMSEAKEQLNL